MFLAVIQSKAGVFDDGKGYVVILFEEGINEEENREQLVGLSDFSDPLAKSDHVEMLLIHRQGFEVCCLCGNSIVVDDTIDDVFCAFIHVDIVEKVEYSFHLRN